MYIFERGYGMNTKIGRWLYHFPSFWLLLLSIIGLTVSILGVRYDAEFFLTRIIIFIPMVVLSYKLCKKEAKNEEY